MKLRWKWLFAFIALLVAPLLLVAVMHFKFKHDVEAYKKQLVAAGEKITIAEWIPRAAPNGSTARIFQESARPFSSINRDHHPSTMRMVAWGRAQVSWKSEEIYESDFKMRTNLWAIISNDFEGNAQALEELRAATENRELVFPIAYEMGFRALLPHLSPIKQVAAWLSASATYELHEGNKAKAEENLNAALRLVKNYKGEPFLIGHLVRIACLQIAFNATWEALQFPNWTDSELKEFQENWAAIQWENPEAIFSMERAMGIQTYAEARETGQDPLAMVAGSTASTLLDDLNEFKDQVMTDPKAAFKALLNRPNLKVWKWVQSYREELVNLKKWQAGLETSRSIEKSGAYQPAMKKLQEKFDSHEPTGEDFLFGDSRSMISRTIAKFASAKIAQQLVVTACALERFKLENKRYPKELKELIPKFLAAIPRDPIDGQPLRYRMKADGTFLLYSIGENGVDDGGEVKPEKKSNDQKWIRPRHPLYGRDWIWPSPATEEEIIEWERHESGKAK